MAAGACAGEPGSAVRARNGCQGGQEAAGYSRAGIQGGGRVPSSDQWQAHRAQDGGRDDAVAGSRVLACGQDPGHDLPVRRGGVLAQRHGQLPPHQPSGHHAATLLHGPATNTAQKPTAESPLCSGEDSCSSPESWKPIPGWQAAAMDPSIGPGATQRWPQRAGPLRSGGESPTSCSGGGCRTSRSGFGSRTTGSCSGGGCGTNRSGGRRPGCK